MIAVIGAISFSKKHSVIPVQLRPITTNGLTFDFRTDVGFQKLFKGKQSYALGKTASVNMSDIYAIYAMTSRSARQAAFRLLTAEEKYVFMDTLAERNINTSNLNSSQKALLHSFQVSVLSIDIYEDNSSGQTLRDTLYSYVPQLVSQFAAEGIDTGMLNNLFSTATYNPEPQNEVTSSPENFSCQCNEGSPWNTACKKCGCISSTFGCSWFMFNPCNGMTFSHTIGGLDYYEI